jgi:outer membrane protein OmpA-like peptidoglycan-associated protein
VPTERRENPRKKIGEWSSFELNIVGKLSYQGIKEAAWEPFLSGVTALNFPVMPGMKGTIAFNFALVKKVGVGLPSIIGDDDIRAEVPDPEEPYRFAYFFDFVCSRVGKLRIVNPHPGPRDGDPPLGVDLQPYIQDHDDLDGAGMVALVPMIAVAEKAPKVINISLPIKIKKTEFDTSIDIPLGGSPGSSYILRQRRILLHVFEVPSPPPIPNPPKIVLEHKVKFKPEGESKMSTEAKLALHNWATGVRQDPKHQKVWAALKSGRLKLNIYGYATNTATESGNNDLSKLRAEEVRKYLKGNFSIDGSIEALGIKRVDPEKPTVKGTAPKGPIDAERYVHVFIMTDEVREALQSGHRANGQSAE